MNAAFEDPHSLSTPYSRIDCGTIMNGKCLIRTERFSGCYQGLIPNKHFRPGSKEPGRFIKSGTQKSPENSSCQRKPPGIFVFGDVQEKAYITAGSASASRFSSRGNDPMSNNRSWSWKRRFWKCRNRLQERQRGWHGQNHSLPAA